MTQSTPDAATETVSTRYEPEAVETRWIATWDERGTFHAEVNEGRPAYSIVIPPPNVTGALHMGHALNGSIQDCLIRYHRMRGFDTLWVPGVDHAGIATQAVVERTLRAEGTTRYELGREKFLERVWEWKHEYGETIIGQFRRLGCSLDYRRERFTMDEQYHRAVLDTFVRLFERDYIYRDNYLVNWDAGTMSAISDLEVEQRQVDDEMVEVGYLIVDESGAAIIVAGRTELVIATVRAETIPADVAVAVHPKDDRYTELVGKHVRVPFSGRIVPIIADEYVDIEFGTGALKITPGHDPNDFEIGNKHSLERLSAITPERTMSDICGAYAGLGVDDARGKMIDQLEQEGLLRGREPYRHSVPHSQRSGVRIEPLISLQWFADMRELAKPALAAVRDESVRFRPDGAKNIFFSWMEDLKPWCLSRQLWWGHQLPVWYCAADDSHVHVSVDGPGNMACPECGGTEWRQDEDVLDTWFSSGLWDMATLGWPDDTPELRHFHPTSVLCTARDIINLWVARMMMFSLDFLGEVPFRDVYIHSTIQAADGRRMSKSLGTGIDPLKLIASYGADATRYGLLDMSSTQDVRFNEGRIREGRDLANKLWNAVRLTTLLGDADALAATGADGFDFESVAEVEDLWILGRLDRAVRDVSAAIDNYDFALAAKTLYAFIWNELCDWYLEAVKGRLRAGEDAPTDADRATRIEATRVLSAVLDYTLRMLHPVMPHVTEELSIRLWPARESDKELVAQATWHAQVLGAGVTGVWADAEAAFGQVQALVSRLRSLRQAADIKPKVAIVATLDIDAAAAERWQGVERIVHDLANVQIDAGASGSDGIALPLDGAMLTMFGLDPQVLKPRLEADLKAAGAEVKRAEGKLSNERFTARAPVDLVAEERAKVDRFTRERELLTGVIAQLG